MKTTKTSPFQGNIHLMPIRVYIFFKSSHQIPHRAVFHMLSVPLKAILQTMSLVIKGSPAQFKQTAKLHRHPTKPNAFTYFHVGRSSIKKCMKNGVGNLLYQTPLQTRKKQNKKKSNFCFAAFSLIQLPSYMRCLLNST